MKQSSRSLGKRSVYSIVSAGRKQMKILAKSERVINDDSDKRLLSATAEGPRDAVSQLKWCQLLHSSTTNLSEEGTTVCQKL